MDISLKQPQKTQMVNLQGRSR